MQSSKEQHSSRERLPRKQCKEVEENNIMGNPRDFFKRTFHAKMGTIKDRNGMDLTKAEDIKKRW